MLPNRNKLIKLYFRLILLNSAVKNEILDGYIFIIQK